MTAASEAVQQSVWFTLAPSAADRPAKCWFLCFPHAGAGAAPYLGWAKLLPPGIALRVAQLPGRAARFREPPCRDARSLARALLPAVESLADRPVALFGHSLGALVAFELAVAMRESGLALPVHLYLSARQAPHLGLARRQTWNLDDGALRTWLRELGGTPEEVLRDPKLFAMIAPALRADLEMNERYEYREQAPLAIPITAFAAAGDARAVTEGVAGWAAQTSRRFTLVRFEGGHFSLLARPRLLTDRVLADGSAW